MLAFSIIFLLSAKVVGENASNANIALNAKTSFMRGLADKAQVLVTASKTTEAKTLVSKVFDAIRYSDNVSTEETQMDEMKISVGLEDLKCIIQDGEDIAKIQHKVEEILLLIEKRNSKCKALKRQV